MQGSGYILRDTLLLYKGSDDASVENSLLPLQYTHNQPCLPPSLRQSTQNFLLPESAPGTSWCSFLQSWIVFTSIRISKQGSKSPALSLVARPFSNRFTVKVSTWSCGKREQIMFPNPCIDLFNNTGWRDSHSRHHNSHTALELLQEREKKKKKKSQGGRESMYQQQKVPRPSTHQQESWNLLFAQCSYWYFYAVLIGTFTAARSSSYSTVAIHAENYS